MPLFSNTKLNNPNAFHKGTDFRISVSGRGCSRSAHTASNAPKDKKTYSYYGYKEHVAIAALITPANVADSSAALPLLHKAHAVLSLHGGNFLVDNGYGTKAIYNTVHTFFAMMPFIPLKSRNTKQALFSNGRLFYARPVLL